MLAEDMMPLFEGRFPSIIATVSGDGVPNVSNLSRVWYVDAEHVAIANQLLSKTARNLYENPYALLRLIEPKRKTHWELSVRLERAESTGALFDAVRRDLHTLYWISGGSAFFDLREVLVFRVLAAREGAEEALHLRTGPEAYGDLLEVLSEAFGWSRMSYWAPMEEGEAPSLLASRGVAGAGIHGGAFEPMRRLAMLAKRENRWIRLTDARSQMRYIKTMEQVSPGWDDFPNDMLAIPLHAVGTIVGIVCCEASDVSSETIRSVPEPLLTKLAASLGEAMVSVASVPETERKQWFGQAVERTKLEWEKQSEPFYALLSPRERQVAMHAAQGRTNAEIARLLFVSPRTVTTHLERIFQKLDINSRTSLARYMTERGLQAEPADEGENT
ncbi:LuxR C-terminal-related transcriptional regulator [Paenibacillus sp.]|uniref:LuxR C-terminal-related transcriptional regulator n=1 Tax=Paenibacillus sp. TaxID=58172 RepID=UPI002D45AC28|nr:LuxR C-terminal-related transcriptional regulator [Paenibacillus sp.]HZG84794.1 LuxR C-terminal-related transcriptional regulator [Paenibacillus sp.]